MSKRKICVVVTARPSYSRIRSALEAIKANPNLELQLVVAASALLDRYGNAVQSIERDGFEIAARVYMVVEGENLVTSAKSTGLGLVELATVFDNLKPDAVVTIASAFALKKWTSFLASSDVIHLLSPLASAVRPSRLIASLIVI